MMMITGLYIVKNEAEGLRRSIQSIINICDEIVVVDTGSEDDTVETAKSLGATVHHFEWVNDFSKARNFALSKARGDLIIFIDSDEWFPEPLGIQDRTYLEGLLSKGYRIFDMLRSNIRGGVATTPAYNTRMLRGKAGIHYVGAIHETVSDVRGSFYLPERFLLHHSGYDGTLVLDKSRRNLELLSSQFEKETNPRARMALCYYLARESRNLGKAGDALKYIDEFFALWRKAPARGRDKNVGISMYDFAARACSVLGGNFAPDRKYLAICQEFIRDFPAHPASLYAMANYEYVRNCDYTAALKLIERVERAAESYDVKDYPHDQVGADRPVNDSMLIKGNILYDRGDRGGAFDCYASVLRSIQPTAGFLRRLLHLIKDQPAEDIVAFISAIPSEMSVNYIELLLQQLVYFPQLKDIYLHFSIQHLKLTRQHTDLTAVASLINGESYELLADVARSLTETDPLTAGKLLIIAAVRSGDPDVRRRFPEVPQAGRILDSFFSDQPMPMISDVELTLYARAFPVVLFLCDTHTKRRFLRILESYSFFRAYVIMHHCNISGDYEALMPFVQVDTDSLDQLNRAAFFNLMGRANISLGEYRDAMYYLKQSFELNPGSLRTRRSLQLLASVSPEYSDEARRLMRIFSIADVSRQEDANISAINTAFDD